MATFLDFNLLGFLFPLFVFFFVYLVLYGLFNKFNILGEDKNIHTLVALILALLFVLIADLRNLLTLIIPFFVLFFIVLTIIFIGVMLLGFKQEDITKYIRETPSIVATVVVIVIVIFLIGAGTLFPEAIGFPSSTQTGVVSEARRIIFNPKVLGVIFILVVTSFLIRAVGSRK
ncbi:MAG: hypothetical protein AABX90_02190 [Nanoarchaeota archaeon]